MSIETEDHLDFRTAAQVQQRVDPSKQTPEPHLKGIPPSLNGNAVQENPQALAEVRGRLLDFLSGHLDGLPDAKLEDLILRLHSRKPFVRKKERAGTLHITDPSGRSYIIRRIESPNSKEIPAVHQLREKFFEPKEMPPRKILGRFLRANRNPDEKSDFILSTISEVTKDEVTKAEVIKRIGFIEALLYALPDKQNVAESNESVLLIGFVAVEPDYRRAGLTSELMAYVMSNVHEVLQREGKKLRGIAGEVVEESESFFNSIGLKRVYMHTGISDDMFEELNYFQPPTKYDRLSGLPPPGAALVPEHLMILPMNDIGKDMRREVLDTISAFYHYDFYRAFYAHYQRDPSLRRAPQLVEMLFNKMEDQLKRAKNVVLLSAQERKALLTKGAWILEHSVKPAVLTAENGLNGTNGKNG